MSSPAEASDRLDCMTRQRPLASPLECITKMFFLRGRIFGFSAPGRASLTPGCQHGEPIPPSEATDSAGKPSFCSLARSVIIGSVYERLSPHTTNHLIIPCCERSQRKTPQSTRSSLATPPRNYRNFLKKMQLQADSDLARIA